MQMDYSTQDIEAFVARLYTPRPSAQNGFQPETPNTLITPFGYNTTFAALAQNGQQTNTITIAANADFVLLGFRHRAQIGAAQTVSTKTAAFVRVTITDSGTNEQYTNGAVDLANYSSDGFYDNNLPYPRVIAGRSSLTVVATNYAPTAETYTTLDLFLEGVLVRVTP